MQRLRISDIASYCLEQWLDALMRGHLGLHELPSAVAAIYNAGWADRHLQAREERAEAAAEVARLIRWYEYQLNLAYLRLVTAKERKAMFEQNLLREYEREEAAVYAVADGDSDGGEAAGGWLTESANDR